MRFSRGFFVRKKAETLIPPPPLMPLPPATAAAAPNPSNNNTKVIRFEQRVHIWWINWKLWKMPNNTANKTAIILINNSNKNKHTHTHKIIHIPKWIMLNRNHWIMIIILKFFFLSFIFFLRFDCVMWFVVVVAWPVIRNDRRNTHLLLYYCF